MIFLLPISTKSDKERTIECNTISTSLCPLFTMQYFHILYPYYTKVTGRSHKSHYRTFAKARCNAVVTSYETICCLLISIWPGSEKGESAL